MNNNNGTNGKDRIEFLRVKRKQLDAELAAELERERQKEARDNNKIDMALGQAARQMAAQNEGFKTMLGQTIVPMITDEKTRKLLASRGLI
jgi:hypothetical protein